MVDSALKPASLPGETRKEIVPPFKWTSISVQEIVEKDHRLEASVYGIEGRQARKDLEKCKWDIVPLGNEFIKDAFYLSRFKRIYVDKKNGIPFILPSQITEIYPKAVKFISSETNIDIESTRVNYGQILLTRSGTVGVVSYVTKTLENKSLSDDIIRIETKEYPGYIYAYLKSKIGRLLIETNNYGAVISHIEPEHLNNIPIPNPSPVIKIQIHNLIAESFRLRDESNELMDESQVLLKETLQLPDIEVLQAKAKQFEKKVGFLNFSVSLNELNSRFDGSYHIPIVKVIEEYLAKNAMEVTTIGDNRISKNIILPVYELDPSNKKYLSLTHHEERIKSQLTLQKNMIMVTCSGTIGKVTIVLKHWEGWTANQHIIRIVPANNEISGYLHAWISSDYAYPLITRYTYGAVVDEIDNKQVSWISIPLLQDADIQRNINDKVLEANRKRTEAYKLEQEALKILNEQVIYTQKKR